MDFRNCKHALQLYHRCLPVKGATRSLICDLDRFSYELVPNSLHELILKYDGVPFCEIYNELNEYAVILDEYFDFLNNKEFLNLNDNCENFPALPLTYHQAQIIGSAIIDIGHRSDHDFPQIFDQLSAMFCKELQLRFYSEHQLKEIEGILALLNESPVRSIELVVPYTLNLSKYLHQFCNGFPRITSIIIYGSPEFETETIRGRLKITHIKDKVKSASHCGVFYPELYSYSVSFFSESQHHNTCLNRKISIDTEGNIKNCPSMTESFGNIRDTTLKQAIEKPGFKKYWNITKDQIAICKDCEFRHICTDCRAYLENPEDDYSKPLKCGYNPYTCEWEEWSLNPLKQKAITYYGLQGLKKS